jgi:maleylpyruvate isomerase
MIHAVDLDPALSFDALPDDFLPALVGDVVTRRSGGEGPALVLRRSRLLLREQRRHRG